MQLIIIIMQVALTQWSPFMHSVAISYLQNLSFSSQGNTSHGLNSHTMMTLMLKWIHETSLRTGIQKIQAQVLARSQLSF